MSPCKNGTCLNTFGSFICRCPTGSTLDITGLSCEGQSIKLAIFYLGYTIKILCNNSLHNRSLFSLAQRERHRAQNARLVEEKLFFSLPLVVHLTGIKLRPIFTTEKLAKDLSKKEYAPHFCPSKLSSYCFLRWVCDPKAGKTHLDQFLHSGVSLCNNYPDRMHSIVISH